MELGSMAVAVLCSQLGAGEGRSPLEPREWNRLEEAFRGAGMKAGDLFYLSREDYTQRLGLGEGEYERISRLLEGRGTLEALLSRYEEEGIRILTREDLEYPPILKQKLGKACPPLFYVAGETGVLQRAAIGYVGSREPDGAALDFIHATVPRAVQQGFALVSGGARGCDSAAEERALASGGCCVVFLPGGMGEGLKRGRRAQALRRGQLVLLSPWVPQAGFSAAGAMMRNRYIYAHSRASVVVRAEYARGGTWAGATDALKGGHTAVLCYDHPDYAGNQALIRQGAIGVGRDWSADLSTLPRPYEQLGIFDLRGL